jgi:hypothetical protein
MFGIDELFNMGDEEGAVLSTDPPRTIQVKFFDQYETAKTNQVEVSSSSPEAHCKSTDLENLPDDVTITIRGKIYLIKEFQPDGTGLTVLKLTLNN